MASLAGTCGKCGAPYFYTDEAYGGDVPPPVNPTCLCWNVAPILTTTAGFPTTLIPAAAVCEHCLCQKVYSTTSSPEGWRCCKCTHVVHTGVTT